MLRLYNPAPHVLINGFPASIIVWKSEEYEALEIKPPDAILVKDVWVALRME